MTEQAPAPGAAAPGLNLPKQPPAIVIGALRSVTPWIVLWLTGLLAKANVHLDNQWLTNAVTGALAAVAATVWYVVVRLLETRVAPWWGRLLVVAKAPAYSPNPAPAPAPVVVTEPAPQEPAAAVVPPPLPPAAPVV